MEVNKTYEEHLRELVRNSEERYISYGKMLEGIFKDKINFPPGDTLVEWYKEFLREGKNSSESDLKNLREELTFFRQGMNPPFCYKQRRKVLIASFSREGAPVTITNLEEVLFKGK